MTSSMSGMVMDMASSTVAAGATATSAAAAATSSAMSMDMGSSDCKISMLWNWNTIDACFISTSWHITSTSMFAGSCIGVIILVMSLEFFRRLSKEYNSYLIRQHQRSLASFSAQTDSKAACGNTTITASPLNKSFRPNPLQHAVQSLLHMVQFAIAYFVMLLAMYYNGYFLICIFIGAFLGHFVFAWETVGDIQEEATLCCG